MKQGRTNYILLYTRLYKRLHKKYSRLIPKPDKCLCGNNKKIELCNISQYYLDDINDWEWLCTKCHHSKYHSGKNYCGYGIKLSPERRKNMSLAGKKKIFSPEHRHNLSLAAKGKIFSSKHRNNLSISQKKLTRIHDPKTGRFMKN